MSQNNAVPRTPKIVTGPKEDRMLAALTAQPFSKIEESKALAVPVRKTATLPAKIRRIVGMDSNTVILFTSAYARENAPSVAFQAARSAAIQTTGKVLYIHISDRLPKFFRDIETKIPITLDEFVKTGGGSVLPFVVLEDSGLVCAHFRGPAEYMNVENLKTLIASLREYFDLTVFGGDNMLANGASLNFSDLVDGTILVTEAERTRAPVARRLKQTVEENGGKVIGAILNHRKYHIPGWLYQLLYGGG